MGMESFPRVPGFRFQPTDVELVKYYLKRKVLGKKLVEAIAEVDIYKYAPWDLPDKSCLKSRDLKWFFFCPREKKYANGARTNRATEVGYWKTTGKDRPVHYKNEVVGMIKTLVFHTGKAPKGDRTDWVMHEYRLVEKDLADRGVVQDAYVICMVFQKEGPGPRNGAQYGAPFREEDWDDGDDDDDVHPLGVMSSAYPSTSVPNQVSPLAASSVVLEGPCNGPSESCLSDPIPNLLSPATVGNNIPQEDDIASMLEFFTEENTEIHAENDQDKNHEHVENSAPINLDRVDIYNGLADLGNLGGVGGDFCDFISSSSAAYNTEQMSMDDFIELIDLDPPLNAPAEAAHFESNCPNDIVSDLSCFTYEQPSIPVHPLPNQSAPAMQAGTVTIPVHPLPNPSAPTMQAGTVTVPVHPLPNPSAPVMQAGTMTIDNPSVTCFKENGSDENASQALLEPWRYDDVSEMFFQGSHNGQWRNCYD